MGNFVSTVKDSIDGAVQSAPPAVRNPLQKCCHGGVSSGDETPRTSNVRGVGQCRESGPLLLPLGGGAKHAAEPSNSGIASAMEPGQPSEANMLAALRAFDRIYGNQNPYPNEPLDSEAAFHTPMPAQGGVHFARTPHAAEAPALPMEFGVPVRPLALRVPQADQWMRQGTLDLPEYTSDEDDDRHVAGARGRSNTA